MAAGLSGCLTLAAMPCSTVKAARVSWQNRTSFSPWVQIRPTLGPLARLVLANVAFPILAHHDQRLRAFKSMIYNDNANEF